MECGLDVKNIAVTTDLSGNSLSAVQCANKISKGCSAKVYLIHVLADIGTTIGYIPSISLAEIESKMRESISKQLEHLKLKELGDAKETEIVILRGNPANKIVEFVDKNDIDMVVIATTGKHGLEKLLLGSVAEKVIKRSKKSVFVVKTKESS